MYTEAVAKRTRDPEGRRNLILRAAGELIREIGVSALTHRKVAERAKVPLGSTTQYFASLTDLIAEALTGMAEQREAMLDEVAQDIIQAEDVASVLADLVEDAISDPTLLRNELSFWLCYAIHPKLEGLMRSSDEVVLRTLSQISTPEQARAIVVHIYGVMLHIAVHGRTMPREEMKASFRRLLSDPPVPESRGGP
ncbi:TetR family transcriptional regulator [Arachnia propionica]|uniref:TetR family transcriptional regulator n=1 Tax=Arachnia propionica TaxID=1750 RepID=A0A3P1TDQ6_9ACTN|nr:TetR family transcriptional regulator [Arachnia propionica]